MTSSRLGPTRDRPHRFGRPLAWSGKMMTLLCLLSLCSSAGAVDWELLPSQSHDVDLSVKDSVINIRTDGRDPYVVGRWIGDRKSDDQVLEFDYFCAPGVDSFMAHFGPPITAANRIDLPELPISQGWQTYTANLRDLMKRPLPESASLLRLDFGDRADVRLQIRGVRLRPPTQRELQDVADQKQRRQRKLEQDERIANYIAESFPASLDVHVDGSTLRIVPTLPAAGDGIADFELVEMLPEHSIGDLQSGIECKQYRITSESGPLTMELPRHDSGRDRLHSGWRIRSRQSGEFVSARHFPSEIVPDTNDHAPERPRPKSQKGLSGFSSRGPRSDLLELGIDGVTINLVLNRFITNSPGPGKEKIDASGPPVFFDTNAFRTYDALIEFARQHEIVVSAIVLVPRSRRTTSLSPLVHPECDGGVYAMPDLTSERGVKIYSHVLDAIGNRYRHTDRAPGGITNWIAHNEVDFHPMWTNMGRQPRQIFTETYYRSMRMIHAAARSHNPHARVFASLTHHWVVPDDGNWQQLSPRELLETLQRYSDIEGDFAWGVAYHPYPQSLFADVAWQDTRISDDFDTPLITLENLQVLGRFLDKKSMRDSENKMRPVLLSEQGFHTPSYDDRAQANQAGSLRFAMNRVREMPWVESFHYHRWIDHPDEGGLMLGLRTLPSGEHPHGQPKRAWHLYRAIGTAEEQEAAEGLPTP